MSAQSYLRTTEEVYREAALEPQVGLCCGTTPVWKLPGLNIPDRMLEMNYGCGTTIHPRDLTAAPKVLYVGVGGGMELLQFAYFSRHSGSVIGVDPVEEMLRVCKANLRLAEQANSWFREDFIDLRVGSALNLPLEDASVDVAAQNCLFNIFRPEDLRRALEEMYRVLRPHGRLILSDPICETEIPEYLRKDERLRALCLTGAISLDKYLDLITKIGFGTIEIRARRPYRFLDPEHYGTSQLIYVESVEICATNDPVPEDGPCIFSGRTAIYFGTEESFSDGNGHSLQKNQPLSICDKTASALQALQRPDILVTEPTYFYDGGGCC